MNQIFCTPCNGHGLEPMVFKIATMPIWEEVVRRFLIMYPLIKPEEHQYIPDQLLQEVNQV